MYPNLDSLEPGLRQLQLPSPKPSPTNRVTEQRRQSAKSAGSGEEHPVRIYCGPRVLGLLGSEQPQQREKCLEGAFWISPPRPAESGVALETGVRVHAFVSGPEVCQALPMSVISTAGGL